MGPFVLVESGNGSERERKRERKKGREKGGAFSSRVAPVTVLPCGPQSEGWRKEREGWSVMEAEQQKPLRRVEGGLRGKTEEGEKPPRNSLKTLLHQN